MESGGGDSGSSHLPLQKEVLLRTEKKYTKAKQPFTMWMNNNFNTHLHKSNSISLPESWALGHQREEKEKERMEKRKEKSEREERRKRKDARHSGTSYIRERASAIMLSLPRMCLICKWKGCKIRLHLIIRWFLPRIRSKKVNGLWSVYTVIGPQTALK